MLIVPEQLLIPDIYTVFHCFFRERRDRHRLKNRDGSIRGDKSVMIQAPGEPLLDPESTIPDDRVRFSFSNLSVFMWDLCEHMITNTHSSYVPTGRQLG